MQRSSLAVVVTLGLMGCGDDLFDPFEGLVKASGAPPFADGCNGQAQQGESFAGAELEPHLAIDPTDPSHLIAAWQQDRWSNGGANGLVTAISHDGGATWARTAVPFSRCAHAARGSSGDYERASDPWVTFTPAGIAYQIALAFDSTRGPRNAILASRSTDGGHSWEEPTALIADDDPDVFNDKESITADPKDPRRVYAVWDRITGLTHPRDPTGTGPTWFARTSGATWEPARPIFDPGLDAQTIGNQIVVLADGTLINGMTVIRQSSTARPSIEAAVLRSTDQGATWSAPISVATMQAATVVDARNDVPIRSGTIIAELEADPRSGAVYLAWEDSRFTFGSHSGIALVRSMDRGATWSAPMLVNGDARFHAFTPALAVAADGTLALTYYDLRDSAPDELMVTAWLATSRDLGATWTEEALTGPFDLRSTLFGRSYFLGDYQGLVASVNAFLPLFAAALVRATPTAIFARPVARAVLVGTRYAASAARRELPTQPGTELRALTRTRPFVLEADQEHDDAPGERDDRRDQEPTSEPERDRADPDLAMACPAEDGATNGATN